jgi:hypothetical protein
VLAAVPLLIDSLLWCSPDVSVVVIDARISEARVFIPLLLGGAQTNGHRSCHGECWLGIARFTVGGSHGCILIFLIKCTSAVINLSSWALLTAHDSLPQHNSAVANVI